VCAGGYACEVTDCRGRRPPASEAVVRELGVHAWADGPQICGVAACGGEVPVEVDLVPAPGARACEVVACARAVTPAKSPTAAAAARQPARM